MSNENLKRIEQTENISFSTKMMAFLDKNIIEIKYKEIVKALIAFFIYIYFFGGIVNDKSILNLFLAVIVMEYVVSLFKQIFTKYFRMNKNK